MEAANGARPGGTARYLRLTVSLSRVNTSVKTVFTKVKVRLRWPPHDLPQDEMVVGLELRGFRPFTGLALCAPSPHRGPEPRPRNTWRGRNPCLQYSPPVGEYWRCGERRSKSSVLLRRPRRREEPSASSRVAVPTSRGARPTRSDDDQHKENERNHVRHAV